MGLQNPSCMSEGFKKSAYDLLWVVIKSSSAGEFHPHALTEPDVTVSRHPALIVQLQKQPCLTHWLIPFLVDQSVRQNDITPSLPPHYRDFFATTGYSATVPRIGTLTLGGASTLSFSLRIGTSASHVPHKSLDQVHATFMPDAIRAVNRFPPDLSWRLESHQF